MQAVFIPHCEVFFLDVKHLCFPTSSAVTRLFRVILFVRPSLCLKFQSASLFYPVFDRIIAERGPGRSEGEEAATEAQPVQRDARGGGHEAPPTRPHLPQPRHSHRK